MPKGRKINLKNSLLIFLMITGGCVRAANVENRPRETQQCKPQSSDLSQTQILDAAKAKLVLPKAELQRAEFFISKQEGSCGWSVIVHPQSSKPGSAIHLKISNDGKNLEIMPSW